jgi:alpha-L-fucosidase
MFFQKLSTIKRFFTTFAVNKNSYTKHMNRRFLFLTALLLLAVFPVMGQEPQKEDSASYEKRMEWFGNAKLGIFIHWGIYAVRGVSESWSFYNEYLPYDEYMSQAKGFTAKNYDPKAWVDLIKESGAQYTVITTKHHDGMALWDTKAGELSMKKCTPAKRDLITPFAKEVRSHGLKLGLYYSLLDWSNENYPNKTKNQKRYTNDPQRWDKFVKFNMAQLSELSNEFNPDLFWFDGDWEQTAEAWHSSDIIKLLRKKNPNVIVNSRIQGYGDYATPEQGIPVTRPSAEYWELCQTINDSWGYQPTDQNFKSPYQVLRTFCDCLSNGGNLLLDIGPREDGTIPQEEVDVLKELGRWTHKHAEAIYGTRAGIPAYCFQGYNALNKDGDILYLYIPYRPNGCVEVKGLLNRVNRVWVVGNGTMLNYKIYNKAYWSSTPGNLYIDVPDSVLDPQITVLAVLLDGPVKYSNGQGQVITAN